MTEDELTYMSSHRADGVAYPDESPAGWVHLTTALSRFGQSLLQGDWEYVYFDWANHAPPIAKTKSENVERLANHAYWNECKERVARDFLWCCWSENIITGHRPAGGGSSVAPMKPEHWELENIYQRFETFSFDPANPASVETSLPDWIWVQEESLVAVCHRINASINNHGRVVYYTQGEFCSVKEAIELLLLYFEPSDSIPILGFPRGATELAALLASGAVTAFAGRMERKLNADRRGNGGTIADGRNDWEIPATAWDGLKESPNQNWLSGSFVLRSDGRNTLTLDGVQINRWLLLEWLEQQGRLIRVQFRVVGTAHMEEGFAPVVSGDRSEKAAVIPEPNPLNSGRSTQRTDSFARQDNIIVQKMKNDVDEGRSENGWAAALNYTDDAPKKSGTDIDSVRRRLHARYQEQYRE